MRRLKFASILSIVTGLFVAVFLYCLSGMFFTINGTAALATASEQATTARKSGNQDASKPRISKNMRKNEASRIGVASSGTARPNPLRSTVSRTQPSSQYISSIAARKSLSITQVSQPSRQDSIAIPQSEAQDDSSVDLSREIEETGEVVLGDLGGDPGEISLDEHAEFSAFPRQMTPKESVSAISTSYLGKSSEENRELGDSDLVPPIPYSSVDVQNSNTENYEFEDSNLETGSEDALEGDLENLENSVPDHDAEEKLTQAAPFESTNAAVPVPGKFVPRPAVGAPGKIDETPQNADPFGEQIDSGAVVRPPLPDRTSSPATNRRVMPRTRENATDERLTRISSEVKPIYRPMDRNGDSDTPLKNTELNVFSEPFSESEREEASPSQTQQPQGIGVPGSDELSGAQTPKLTIEKIAPEEIQLNRPTVLKTIIRNVGDVTAKDVVLRDLLPRGTRLLSLKPETTVHADGEIFWSLGDLTPQHEVVVEMECVPIQEGEIGSVATVQFSTEVSVKTLVTQAMLELEVASETEVLIGEDLTYQLTLSNPGTGKATGVVVEYHVPEGLTHEKGKKIVYAVGELQSKETKTLPLVLRGVAPGSVQNRFRAYAENELESVAETTIEVLAPRLQLEIAGPKQRYLNRKAAYTLTVSNPGTASAFDIDLVAHLPKGMRFEKTNQSGLYDETTHTIHWALAELPAQGVGEMELFVVPESEGDHTIRLEGRGTELAGEVVHQVSVRGLPAVGFEVSCLSDPVELGKPAIYEVKLSNRGTRSAHKVNLFVQLAQGMEFSSAEGPVRHQTKGNQIRFEPLSVLEPNEEKIYKFTARCLQAGDHRISVSVNSEEQKTPITREESTLVYGDE